MKISQKNFSEFFVAKLDEAASTKTSKKILKEGANDKAYPSELSKIPSSLKTAFNQARVMVAGYADMVAQAISNKSQTKAAYRKSGAPIQFGWSSSGEVFVSTELSFYVPHGNNTPEAIESFIPPKIAKMITFRNPNVDGNYVFYLSFQNIIGKNSW